MITTIVKLKLYAQKQRCQAKPKMTCWLMDLAPNKNIFINKSVETKEKNFTIWFHVLQPVI